MLIWWYEAIKKFSNERIFLIKPDEILSGL